MLSLRDNAVLALTKLRTRRVRLGITLTVSGLLFSVLIIASLTVRGLTSSMSKFSREGFLDHFIVYSWGANFQAKSNAGENTAIIDRAIALYNTAISQKTAEAKRVGIAYDPISEEKPYTEYTEQGKKIRTLNLQNPYAQQAAREKAGSAEYDEHVQKIAANHHAIGIYPNFSYEMSWYNAFDLAPIIGGKEHGSKRDYGPNLPDPIDSFSQSLTAHDPAMMKPFLLKGASTDALPGDPIPVLAPMNAAESLLGLKPPSSKATASQQLRHVTEVRQRATNYVFDVCYRNGPAIEKLAEAKNQASAIAAHKNEVGFELPSVIYTIPAAPCSAPLISQDNRPAQERLAAEQLAAFQEKFGTPKPVTQPITFKIVGLLPRTLAIDQALSLEAAFASLLASPSADGWVISHNAADAHPILGPIQRDQLNLFATPPSRYIEFRNRQDQKAFIEQYNCEAKSGNSCNKPTDMFLMPFGNPLASVYEAVNSFKAAAMWTLLVIAILSALIMIGTIGKVIADSRRETSVFRALGARRFMIAQVYLLYAAILGLLTFVAAGVIGLAGALAIDAYTTGPLSTTAILAFNTQDVRQQFHLIGWSPLDLATIAGVIIATSLISAAVPLAGNVRRDPIKDMREE